MEDPTTREPHPTPGPRHPLSSFQSRQIALTRETLSKGNSFHLILHLVQCFTPVVDEQGFVSSACVCAPIYTLLRVTTPLLWRMFNWSFSVAYPKQSSQGGVEVEKRRIALCLISAKTNKHHSKRNEYHCLFLHEYLLGHLHFIKKTRLTVLLSARQSDPK